MRKPKKTLAEAEEAIIVRSAIIGALLLKLGGSTTLTRADLEGAYRWRSEPIPGDQMRLRLVIPEDEAA